MRTQPSYSLLLYFSLICLLAPSCDPPFAELPLSTTILLDFSDPNTHAGNAGGYRYIYQGESYSATYNAWETWSCATGPNYFAAWDDTSRTVWLAHCPDQLFLESITAQTGVGDPLPIESWTPVAGAHELTYQQTLDPANYVDIENGTTTMNLIFTYN